MDMKNVIKFIACMCVYVFIGSELCAQVANSDYWSITDALGRKACEYKDAGDKRSDKYVAIFYWTWHQGDEDTTYQIRSISDVLHQFPEAIEDYNHPAWGTKHDLFYWEQPLFGFYRTTDEWVLRKHAEMLADAGVDAVFFDCTNGDMTWKDSYEALMKTWDKAQKDGVKVPKIAFMLPFSLTPGSLVSLRQLYRDVYKPSKYPNLWFMWKGKPIIMAYPEILSDSPEDKAISSFFTFRPGQPDYVNGPKRNDQWGWLEKYPQHGYVPLENEKFEQVTVGIAQNACDSSKGHDCSFNLKDTYGRNYSVQHGFDPRVDGYLYGRNFLEQWERVLQLDPELVFVTGWNEFTVEQLLPTDHWTAKPFNFVDEYNWNCSRDIEPNKGWGDKGDVYYLQLVDNIRRFKGMNKPESVSPMKTIALNRIDDWKDVKPYFNSYKGNTIHRDSRGRGCYYYKNNSGRNDIIGAKVARDENNIYFYVETADRLTSSKDKDWMRLFIDVDRDKSTGWNGYDFVVNHVSPEKGKVTIEQSYQNKWIWNKVGESKFVVIDNVLVFSIPRTLLSLSHEKLNFEFKWNDNMQDEGNIMDFYMNGDTAPGGRFNYIYNENVE